MTLSRIRSVVRDLMQIGVTTCHPDAKIADLARILLDQGLDAIIVLDPSEGN
jgi:CBS domain-containing protein